MMRYLFPKFERKFPKVDTRRAKAIALQPIIQYPWNFKLLTLMYIIYTGKIIMKFDASTTTIYLISKLYIFVGHPLIEENPDFL